MRGIVPRIHRNMNANNMVVNDKIRSSRGE